MVAGAELAVGVDATGEKVVHHAVFDGLVFFDERFGFFDEVVDGGEDFGDFLLFF